MKKQRQKENKKAQGNIIAIVLLILIVVAGALVVFGIIRPLVSEKAGQIPSLAERMQLAAALSVDSWEENTDEACAINVIVSRSSGAGEISGLKYTIEIGDGTICSVEQEDILGQQETKTFVVDLAAAGCSCDVQDIVDVSIEPVFVECTDSDVTDEFPNGKNYYTKGNIILDSVELEDLCDIQLEDRLAERVCTPDQYGQYFVFYMCPNACFDGACISGPAPNCTDTDGGIDYLTKGTVNDILGQEHTDHGFTLLGFQFGNGISEYYCNPDGTTGSRGYRCSTGRGDGVCIGPIEIERSIENLGGDLLKITLNIQVDENAGVSAFIIEETYPVGWEIINSTHNGSAVFNTDLRLSEHRIDWIASENKEFSIIRDSALENILGVEDSVIIYTIRKTTEGQQEFDGRWITTTPEDTGRIGGVLGWPKLPVG